MNLRPVPAKRVVLIGIDGENMELWQRMVAWDRAPNMVKLLANGIVYEAVEAPNWYLKPQ